MPNSLFVCLSSPVNVHAKPLVHLPNAICDFRNMYLTSFSFIFPTNKSDSLLISPHTAIFSYLS